MDNHPFFLWIWRINGVVIAAGTMLLLAMLSVLFLQDILRNTHDSDDNIIVNVADDPKGKEKWELGNAIKIVGGHYVTVPLISENRGVDSERGLRFSDSSYGKYYSQPAKNLLFIDTRTNQAQWLFSNNEQIILNTEQLSCDKTCEPIDSTTLAMFYEITDRDTNGDKLLTYDDRKKLMIGSPDGKRLALVMNQYDRIIAKFTLASNRALIIYQLNGQGRSKIIQLSPFEEISDEPLPHVENVKTN